MALTGTLTCNRGIVEIIINVKSAFVACLMTDCSFNNLILIMHNISGELLKLAGNVKFAAGCISQSFL